MADKRNDDAEDAGEAGKATLPPFGFAQDILRQMTAAEGLSRTIAPSTPLVAAPSFAPAPAGTYQGRDGLLQFADAVMSVANTAPVVAEAEERFVTFFIDKEEYCVPVLRAREIVRVGDITRIPEAPAHIRGVFNLRGRILPIVDLRTRLGLTAEAITPRSRLVLVEAHGRLCALLVDAISQIVAIRRSTVRPPPAEALSTHTDYVTGVAQLGPRLLILLDLDNVLLLRAAGPGAETEDAGSVPAQSETASSR